MSALPDQFSHCALSDLNVIVADNFKPVRNGYEHGLLDAGVQGVFQAQDCEQILLILSTNHVDALFLPGSLLMHRGEDGDGMASFDTLAVIRDHEKYSRLPVIVLGSEAQHEQLAEDAQASAFVMLPMAQCDVAKALGTIMPAIGTWRGLNDMPRPGQGVTFAKAFEF